MPFTLRNMENETKAKMGVVECITHKLIDPFQVLYEKEGMVIDGLESKYFVVSVVIYNYISFTGEYVAQFKFTVLLMPNGPMKITGLPFDPEILDTDKKIEDLDIQVRERKRLLLKASYKDKKS